MHKNNYQASSMQAVIQYSSIPSSFTVYIQYDFDKTSPQFDKGYWTIIINWRGKIFRGNMCTCGTHHLRFKASQCFFMWRGVRWKKLGIWRNDTCTCKFSDYSYSDDHGMHTHVHAVQILIFVIRLEMKGPRGEGQVHVHVHVPYTLCIP